MAKPTQTRRQFLKDFVGPPRRPRTVEERAAAMAAYERAMVEWRARTGDFHERRNSFHRTADSEQDREAARPPAPVAVDPALMARRDAALRETASLCAALQAPIRVYTGIPRTS